MEAAGIELSQDIHQETKAQLNEFGKRLQGGLEQCQASSKRQHLEVLGALSQQDSLGQQEHKATGAQVEQLRVATLAKLDENSSFLFQLDANIENNGSRLAQILDFVQKMTRYAYIHLLRLWSNGAPTASTVPASLTSTSLFTR